MQQMRRVTVSNAGGYDPRNLVVQDTDSVIWINTETVASGIEHRPVPEDTKQVWVENNIPPNSPSPQANFSTLGSFPYHDATNSALTAVVVVTKGVVIGQNGDITAFAPANISIAKGQSVTWANETPAPLLPKPDSGPAWFSQPIASGEVSAPVTFPTPGTITYRCTVPGKPDAVGKITVKA
jgi:plastocyanin